MDERHFEPPDQNSKNYFGLMHGRPAMTSAAPHSGIQEPGNS